MRNFTFGLLALLTTTPTFAQGHELVAYGHTAQRLAAVLFAAEGDLEISAELGRRDHLDWQILELRKKISCLSHRRGGQHGIVTDASCSWNNESLSLSLVLALQEAGLEDTTGQPGSPDEHWLHVVELESIECKVRPSRPSESRCLIRTQGAWDTKSSHASEKK